MSAEPVRVAVLGSRGRMGSTSCEAIEAAEGLELVARVDLDDDLDSLTAAGAQVALDFTCPDAVMGNLRWCLEHGVHVVAGTSGFTDERVDEVRALVADRPDVGVLLVPNFSVGAVLMMRFAQVAAPFFESVEVIELHHPDKVDAPSGTATRTAELVAAARADAGSAPIPDATTDDPDHARGADVAGVRVHAVRSRGMTASQEVLLGAPGETLTLRHDSVHRESFMPGVVAALRAAPELRGVTVGLDGVLGLG